MRRVPTPGRWPELPCESHPHPLKLKQGADPDSSWEVSGILLSKGSGLTVDATGMAIGQERWVFHLAGYTMNAYRRRGNRWPQLGLFSKKGHAGAGWGVGSTRNSGGTTFETPECRYQQLNGRCTWSPHKSCKRKWSFLKKKKHYFYLTWKAQTQRKMKRSFVCCCTPQMP